MSEELSDLAKARKDLLWGMYADLRTHARHAETLRSNVVNFTLVAASVLVAVIANDGHVRRGELPLCLVVALVGLFGLGFSASYTELHERNRKRALRMRQAVEDEFLTGDVKITSLLEESDLPHESGRLYRWSRRRTGTARGFWLLVPAFVFAAGLLLTVIAL